MGYRLAMEETCRYFLEQAGVGSLAPDGEIYSLFESQRVTSEWDMVPLALLIVLDQISQFTPLPEIMEELDGALAWVKANPPAIRQVEYREEILKFCSYIRPGVTAAQAILEAVQTAWRRHYGDVPMDAYRATRTRSPSAAGEAPPR
mgnify:CR=1 FL=1